MPLLRFTPATFVSCRSLVGLALSTLLCAAHPAFADQTLTLELPPSEAAQAAHAAEKARSAAHTSVTPKATRNRRGTYPSRGGVRRPQERVVGRLGQLPETTPIYRRHSRSSALLTQAPAGTYVAIQADAGDWVGVLMADGSTGWMTRSSVRFLDYQVVSNGNVPMPTDEGDIYPRSTTPFFTGDPQLLLQEAYKYMGVRYVWGGNTMNGIDCSGLVKRVFDACGFPLPRLGSDQMAYGIPVPFDQLQPGDRIYFDRRTERVGVKHTGLYVGDGYFIHASSSNHGVAINNLSEPKWRKLFVCARR